MKKDADKNVLLAEIDPGKISDEYVSCSIPQGEDYNKSITIRKKKVLYPVTLREKENEIALNYLNSLRENFPEIKHNFILSGF